ncbi:hypothetical protein [Streptomyces sp. NPDC050848]|uniref:hypothetical protein n=1 Tax=Streptomyces sp. NPDC050848 TaxID=3155791 RepID=UPI0033F88F00
MPGEQQTASYPARRHDGGFAAPRTFVMVDPGRPPHVREGAPGSMDALIIDVLTCAARHGAKVAIDAAAALLLDARERLDAQVWLRIHPADGYLDVAASLADLVGRADGVVLPHARSTADLEEALALLGSATADATAFMAVVDTDAVHTDIERLAGHPAVVRLAAASRTTRVNLPVVSQLYGLPAPVNAVGAGATDACELMHDAVLARCAGFGGQCVPAPELAADARALYRDAGRD